MFNFGLEITSVLTGTTCPVQVAQYARYIQIIPNYPKLSQIISNYLKFSHYFSFSPIFLIEIDVFSV